MVRPTTPGVYVITDVSPAIFAVDKKAYTFRFVYGFIKSDLNVLVSSTLPSSTLNHLYSAHALRGASVLGIPKISRCTDFFQNSVVF